MIEMLSIAKQVPQVPRDELAIPYPRCDQCGEQGIHDERRGEITCPSCGLILTDLELDTNYFFHVNDGLVPATEPLMRWKKKTRFNGIGDHDIPIPAPVKYYFKSKHLVPERISPMVREFAFKYFLKLCHVGIARGRDYASVFSCAIVHACRIHGVAIGWNELEHIHPRSSSSRVLMAIQREGIPFAPDSIENWIGRIPAFCDELGIPDLAIPIVKLIRRVAPRINRAFSYQSLVGGSIKHVAKFRTTSDHIGKCVGISDVSVNVWKKRIEGMR